MRIIDGDFAARAAHESLALLSRVYLPLNRLLMLNIGRLQACRHAHGYIARSRPRLQHRVEPTLQVVKPVQDLQSLAASFLHRFLHRFTVSLPDLCWKPLHPSASLHDVRCNVHLASPVSPSCTVLAQLLFTVLNDKSAHRMVDYVIH